jgi:hypothetical protein
MLVRAWADIDGGEILRQDSRVIVGGREKRERNDPAAFLCPDRVPNHHRILPHLPAHRSWIAQCLSFGAHWRAPLDQAAVRAQGNLLNRIKLMLPVQSPSVEIFPFPFDPNHFYIARIPAQHRGAFRDRHGRRAGMRWTRIALLTRALPRGR